MNKSVRKMENNLLTHTKHETAHFDELSDKRQTVKVSFLPFAGKINVKLNLYYFTCSPVGKYFSTATTDFAMRRETRRQLRRVLFKTTFELTLAQTSTICAEKRSHCDHIFTSNFPTFSTDQMFRLTVFSAIFNR